MALLIVSLLLSGCGGSDTSTDLASTTAVAATPPKKLAPRTPPTKALERKVLREIKRRFGNAPWYPLINHIAVTPPPEHSSVVATNLKDHQRAAQNRREAEEICQAFISLPYLEYTTALYDDIEGGSAITCHDHP